MKTKKILVIILLKKYMAYKIKLLYCKNKIFK